MTNPELPEDTYRLDDPDWWTAVQQRINAMHDDGTFRRDPSLKVDDIVSKWRAERLTYLESNMKDYPPPDPYAAALKMRAANAKLTDAERLAAFEAEFKAARLAALEAERDRHEAHVAAHPSPRLSDDELTPYAPPDPYTAGIAKLREQARTR